MRKGTTVTRPIIIDRAEIILQERTRPVSKNGPFFLDSIHKKLGTELIDSQRKMLGKPLDIHRLQNRISFLAAIGAFGTVDLLRYLTIEITYCRVNATT